MVRSSAITTFIFSGGSWPTAGLATGAVVLGGGAGLGETTGWPVWATAGGEAKAGGWPGGVVLFWLWMMYFFFRCLALPGIFRTPLILA